MKKWIAIVCIVVGIGLISFPKLSEKYHDYQQQKLLNEWRASMEAINNGDNESDADEEEPPAPAEGTDDEEADDEKPAKPDFSGYKNMEGILSIDAIDLMLPILHGASDKNMKTTVASIENTGKPGQTGNYAIAGHRNFTYGRNFNRLDEMKEGDEIEVDTGTEQYTYIVSEKLYVLPEEVWVLEGQDDSKEITLITCHPMEDPTHRLIIKGKIVDP